MEVRFPCKTNIIAALAQNCRTQPCNSIVGLSENKGKVDFFVVTSKAPDEKRIYDFHKM